MELAHTMATVMAEKDKEKYKRPWDIIKHAKKYGAYNFYKFVGYIPGWQMDQDYGKNFHDIAALQRRKYK